MINGIFTSMRQIYTTNNRRNSRRKSRFYGLITVAVVAIIWALMHSK